nr:MAG TPA: hypothetical protein [Caudoviricetes sp.]
MWCERPRTICGKLIKSVCLESGKPEYNTRNSLK